MKESLNSRKTNPFSSSNVSKELLALRPISMISNKDVNWYQLFFIDATLDKKRGEIVSVFMPYVLLGKGDRCYLRYDTSWGNMENEHASITVEKNKFLLTNLSKSSQIKVNDSIIKKQAILSNGDIIQVGLHGPKLLFGDSKYMFPEKIETKMNESLNSYKTLQFASRTVPLNKNSISDDIFNTLKNGISFERYAPIDINIGDKLGRYEIISILDQSEKNIIYKAKHIYVTNEVAIKVLKTTNRTGAEIFLQEAKSLALLNGENVLQVFDAHYENGIAYIVMELMDGKGLDDLLNKFTCLTYEQTLDLLEDICKVLIKQESLGILHLDIKPTNIFMKNNGSFYLYDYGLAGLNLKSFSDSENIDQLHVDTNNYFGTLHYMPPEQFLGYADARSDLYSLGVTAIECLTGLKFRNSSINNVTSETKLLQIREFENNYIDLLKDYPDEIVNIFSYLLNFDSKFRYSTATQLMGDLKLYRYKSIPPYGPYIGTVFVAISFSHESELIYHHITNQLRKNMLKPRRLDKYYFLNDIWNQCCIEIETSRLVVADFSRSTSNSKTINPNVITEASHARAIGKPLIIIYDGTAEELPFDWRSYPIITYKNDKDGLIDLANNIDLAIRTVLNY